MSAQAFIFNPTERTLAATGDGMAPPRLTTTGRAAIVLTQNDKGMMVYDTTINSLFIWNGSAWEHIDGTGTSSNTQVLFNDNGQVGGDSTMAFDKNTDTLTVQNLVVTGTTTALGGLDASSIRAAASDYAAVAFDGATNLTRVTSACQSVGTGDFSIWVRVRIPPTNPSQSFVYAAISNLSNSVFDTTGAFIIDQGTTGAINVYGYVAGVFTLAMTVNGVVANYGGQIVDIVLTRVTSGGTTTATLYINGASVATSTAAVVATSVTSNFFHVGAQGSGQCNTRIYRSVVYNRALSAADVTELITIGVNPADQWGSQTALVNFSPAVLNGGFETNSLNVSGTWGTNVLGSSTATIDTSGSFSKSGTNAGKLTLDASSNIAAFSASNGSAITSPSKRYRISFWARCGASSGACGVQVGYNLASAAYFSTGTILTTTYAQFSTNFVAGASDLVIARQALSAGLAEIYIDDVVLERIGAIVDLDFTVGTGYQATDRSTNSLNGTLFNGVSWTMPETSARLYATTAFNGNSQMLGTLAIPANAMIEDIFVFTTGPGTITVGNASGDSSIVGSTIVAGYVRLPLSAVRSTSGNLWVNSNTASPMSFTIIYSISVGTP